jgi:hypothetical protein
MSPVHLSTTISYTDRPVIAYKIPRKKNIIIIPAGSPKKQDPQKKSPVFYGRVEEFVFCISVSVNLYWTFPNIKI